jgi:hypothetical protein
VVGDQSEVSVVATPRHLVHADRDQPVQASRVQAVGDDPLADPPDAVPVDPTEPADGGLVGLGRQERDQVPEVAAQTRAVPGERHRLDPDPVGRAHQPAQPCPDHHLPATHVGMPPPGEHRPSVVAGGRAERALRTLQATTPQPHLDHDGVGLEDHLGDTDPRKAQQTVECSSDAHGRSFVEQV